MAYHVAGFSSEMGDEETRLLVSTRTSQLGRSPDHHSETSFPSSGFLAFVLIASNRRLHPYQHICLRSAWTQLVRYSYYLPPLALPTKTLSRPKLIPNARNYRWWPHKVPR